MTEALEDEIMSESSDVEGNLEPIVDCGEFYLELDEWEGISETNLNGKITLNSNWTNLLAEKFYAINKMCVLKFKHYWLIQNSSKVRSLLYRASAKCKFDRCLAFTLYIEEEVSVLDKRLVFSSQHTSGVYVHSRQ